MHNDEAKVEPFLSARANGEMVCALCGEFSSARHCWRCSQTGGVYHAPEPMTAERLANLQWYAEQWKPNPLSQDVLDLVEEISRLKSDNDGLLGEIDELKSEIIRLDAKIASLKKLLRECPIDGIKRDAEESPSLSFRHECSAWLDARERAIGSALDGKDGVE